MPQHFDLGKFNETIYHFVRVIALAFTENFLSLLAVEHNFCGSDMLPFTWVHSQRENNNTNYVLHINIIHKLGKYAPERSQDEPHFTFHSLGPAYVHGANNEEEA